MPEPLISSEVLDAIQAEATRAHDKHGNKSMIYGKDEKRLRILIEEVGEVAREMNELDLENIGPAEYGQRIFRELIQVGAMAATWLEGIRHYVEQ